MITSALAACVLQFTLHVSPSLQHFVVYWLYNGLVIAAGLVCIWRGWSGRSERLAWILIGAAVVSWGVGNTIWTFVYVALPSPPYPSVADAFWLAVYPPFYVALLLLLHSRSGGIRRSLWLDGTVMGARILHAATDLANVADTVVCDAFDAMTSGPAVRLGDDGNRRARRASAKRGHAIRSRRGCRVRDRPRRDERATRALCDDADASARRVGLSSADSAVKRRL